MRLSILFSFLEAFCFSDEFLVEKCFVATVGEVESHRVHPHGLFVNGCWVSFPTQAGPHIHFPTPCNLWVSTRRADWWLSDLTFPPTLTTFSIFNGSHCHTRTTLIHPRGWRHVRCLFHGVGHGPSRMKASLAKAVYQLPLLVPCHVPLTVPFKRGPSACPCAGLWCHAASFFLSSRFFSVEYTSQYSSNQVSLFGWSSSCMVSSSM